MRVYTVALCLALAVAGAATSSRAAAPDRCQRTAATPERVAHGDDFESVHTAASAMYCPNDVFVQITACVQVHSSAGWSDAGCVTSVRTYVSVRTPGGRGVALSFDVPCVSGTLRTHVTGGEGLDPTEWDSPTAEIACLGTPFPNPTPTPTLTPEPTTTATPEPTTTATPEPTTTATPEPTTTATREPTTTATPEPTTTATATPTPTPEPTPTSTPEPREREAPKPSDERAAGPAAPHAPAAHHRRPHHLKPPHHRRVAVTGHGVVRLQLGRAPVDASGTARLVAAGRASTARFRLRRGAPVVVRITLTPGARRALARHHRLRARVTLNVVDAAGTTSTESFRLNLATS